MDSSDKKELQVFLAAIKTLEFKPKYIHISMISADVYCTACRLKKAQVFVDIQYQVEKKAKAETDLKSIIPQEYYDFLDIFSKKDSGTLFLYQKYDHKIHLEEEQKPGHIPLYKISLEELNAVK